MKYSDGQVVRQEELLELVCCPKCGCGLENQASREVEEMGLRCTECGSLYPMQAGVLRFVPTEDYATTFGYQWKRFSKVQLDSHNGTDFSESRFRSITGADPATLEGRRVLDVGCGAGRFTEIALNFGATVASVDLSQAVEACVDNNPSGRLLVSQASIYEMPFVEGSFDLVFCIGVIQHTPDPHESIRAIARLVKPGGQIALWTYERGWKAYLGTVGFKYLFRPFTKRLSMERQIAFSSRIVDLFFPIVKWARHRELVGKIAMRMLPISSAHLNGIPLSDEDFRHWVYLDTFDMYSPAHDHPQTFSVIEKLLKGLGFVDIRRMPHGGIAIVGTKEEL